MEAIKHSCYLTIFELNNSVSDEIESTMKSLEAQVRECYEEPSDLNFDDFVEMMVYDGCFIIFLIIGYADEDVFKERGILPEIEDDLLLLENQLPFFVLYKLYHIMVGGDVNQFSHDALSFFRDDYSFNLYDDLVRDKDFKHLLDLVHSCYRPSVQGITQHKSYKKKHTSESTSQHWTEFISCATELDDAGIDFFGAALKKEDPKQGIETRFDIMFTKEVLKIPTLKVQDSTERWLRNYIAYEQFIPSDKPTYFSNYVKFMDNLINTSKDVQLLLNSVWSSKEFYYAEIFWRVNEHCQKKRNRWKAALKKKYFNSPWSPISVFAATVLLLLTILQTIFSLLSYLEQKN